MAILEPMGAPTPPQDSTIGTITKRTRSPSNGDKPVRDKLKKTSISVKPLPVTTSPGEPDSSYAEEVQPTTPTTDTQKSGQEVTQQIDPATKQTAEQTVDRRHTRKRSREHSALDIEQISASRVIRPRREGRSPSPILEEAIPDDHPPSNMKESSRSTTPDTSIDGSTPPSKINSANDSDTKSNAANQSDAIFGKTELAEADEKTKSRPTTPSPTAGHPSPRETTNTNDKPTTPPPVLERQAKRTEVEAASVSSPKASGTTAFASSGLSAFASSSASPFGKITSGKGASAAAFSKPESIITPSSTFGSPKAAGGSAFGGFGAASTGASIFGSPFGKSTKGPGLTSFASGKPAPLGKPEKPFGAPASESEGEEDGDEDESLDEHATNSDVRFTRKDTGQEANRCSPCHNY